MVAGPPLFWGPRCPEDASRGAVNPQQRTPAFPAVAFYLCQLQSSPSSARNRRSNTGYVLKISSINDCA